MVSSYVKGPETTMVVMSHNLLVPKDPFKEFILMMLVNDVKKIEFVQIDSYISELLISKFFSNNDTLFFRYSKPKVCATLFVVYFILINPLELKFTEDSKYHGQIPILSSAAKRAVTTVTNPIRKMNPFIDFNAITFDEIININRGIPDSYKDSVLLFIERTEHMIPPHRIEELKKKLYTLNIIEGNRVTDLIFLTIPHMGGYFDVKSNTIGVNNTYAYQDFNINIEDHKMSTIFHELFHWSSMQFLSDKSAITRSSMFLREGITEFLNKEKFLDFQSNKLEVYNEEIVFVKILIELISLEIVLDAYYNDDFNVILEGLVKIYGTKEDAIGLISKIDNLLLLNSNIPNKKLEDRNFLEQEIIKQLWSYWLEKQKQDIYDGKWSVKSYEQVFYKEKYFMSLFMRTLLEFDKYKYFPSVVMEQIVDIYKEELGITDPDWQNYGYVIYSHKNSRISRKYFDPKGEHIEVTHREYGKIIVDDVLQDDFNEVISKETFFVSYKK